MTQRAKTSLAACAILAGGVAVYLNGLHGPFIFDDAGITGNPGVHKLWPITPILAGPRPTVDLTFAANYMLGQLKVTGYHVVNVVIHLLAALVLFGIVRRTFLTDRLRGRCGESATLLGLVAAILWVVHPLQTESVTYIAQRAESLMGLLYLLTLYCVIRGFSSPHPTRWHAAAIASCALGMGAKPVMVSAPLIILLYDRTFLSGSFREALRRRGLYIGLAVTWLVLARAVRDAFLPGSPSAGFGMTRLSPLVYARSELGVILHYLKLSFWPANLCLDYAWPIAKSVGEILPGAVVVGGILAATAWALIRRAAWSFLGAWFFLILAPTSSIMPIQDLAFEHRMYLPLAAVAVASVIAVYLLGQRLLGGGRTFYGRAALIAFAILTAPALGRLTIARNETYRTAIDISRDTALKAPHNARAWVNLGHAYSAVGLPDVALDCFNRAVGITPDLSEAYNNRAVIYARTGRFAEAFQDCERAIGLRPGSAPPYNNRANIYAQANRLADAIRDYDKAIELEPSYAEAYSNRGLAYDRLGKYDQALRDCNKAVELKPYLPEAYNYRATAYFHLGMNREALRDCDKAIKLNRDYPDAYNNRGRVRVQAGLVAEAVKDFDKAITLNADFPLAYNNRAIAHALLGRYDLALRDCDKAIELKPDFAEAYNNRAAAFFRLKEYEKALADVKKCESLGGRPNPDFVKDLARAMGRTE